MARVDLSQNEFMERFVGQEHIDSNDNQFWYQLLSCSFNFMRVQNPKLVEKTLDPYIVRLTLNNSQSLNIGSLVRVLINRVSKIKSESGQSTSPYYIFQSFNSLYLIRSICKSYIENLSEEQLIKALKAQVDPLEQLADLAGQTKLQAPPPQFQTVAVSQQLTQNGPIHNQNGASPNPETQTATSTTSQPGGYELQSQVDHPLYLPPPPVLEGGSQETTNQTPIDPDSGVCNQKPGGKEVTPGLTMLDQLMSTLVNIIVDIPLTDSTYLLQVEAINAILVLLSVEMYSSASSVNQSAIYKCLMQKRCSIHALVLTRTLLTNFIQQIPVPQESGSIIIGLASGLWKVLTLGYGVQAEEEDPMAMPLLAKQSLLLLNILTNHYIKEKNPYREAMISCQDSMFSLSDPQVAFANANNDAMTTASTSQSALSSNSIKIDFRQLYETICQHLHNDQVALLLYLLLHSNKIFKPYILTTASSELDRLVLPLLKILYTSIEKGSHHVYMVLIIFIILSEDTTFNEHIQRITVRNITWYKDRILGEISLGSLTALIVIKSFQVNAFRLKDKFLHTNLFATLANLSNHLDRLHPYVCQRIIDLLERITKRYLTAVRTEKDRKLSSDGILNPLARALATDVQQDIQDASSIELDAQQESQSINSPAPPAIISAATNTSVSISGDPNGVAAINIIIPDSQSQPPTGDSSNTPIPPNEVHHQQLQSHSQFQDQQLPGAGSSTDQQINISMEDAKLDIGLIEEVIKMMLEVINNLLASKLNENPDLVYTLLYKRAVFNSLLTSHQSFYNMVINIERILTFFYNRIDSYERQLSVDEIKQLIVDTSRNWTYNQSKDQEAKLLFRYVEDDQPEDFFIPYIWTRIYYSSGIAWNPKRIALFNPDEA